MAILHQCGQSHGHNELTNTIEQFIVYVHRNEAHFTYIYVYHTNVSEADNIYKNPPPNVISPIFFAIFISLWGSTHDSAELERSQILGCPRQLQTCARLMQGWVASAWPPPNKNPGLVLTYIIIAHNGTVEEERSTSTRH